MASRLASRLERQAQRRRTERFVILGVAILLLLTIGSFLWGSSLGSKGPLGILGPAPSRVNILVLGVDERSDDVGRSDTMFVVSVDPKKQDVDIISVPRDTRVKIPGFGYDKINHAYAEGKHKLSQRAVEGLIGFPLQHYLVIDFNGFKRIIDALGGVTIDVEKRMYYEDPYDNLVIDLRAGVQTLNGEDAIGYVRYRDGDGDIGRIERQQKFMKAVLQQVTQPSVVGRLPALVKELSAAVRTSMSTSDMVSFAKLMNDARKQGFEGHMVPGAPAMIGQLSYWLPDIVETRQMMAKIMGTTLDAKALSTAKQLAGEYEQSIPKEMHVEPAPPKIEKPEDKAKDKATAADQKAEQTKPGAPTSKTPPAKKAPPATTKLRVEVINASGFDDAGAKMAAEMRKQGFEVVSVIQSSNTARMTTVVDHTGNDAVIKKVSGLPFDYNLSVLKDGVKNAEVTVIIGKNYN
jgi:LCP family protein required for cell wall assembly